ncbi:hypothetical protein [Lentibacillus saliphilus]|uniref:hypothetical protein n=1 Tax=Lentibacillus saliphilus TaxID=2737028 RepID=UPI001C309D81|nr:hypothetical protein [Lentibacillus saliphilus]
MNHPFEKFMKLELAALGIVILTSIIAIVKGFFLLLVIAVYGIAASLIFDGMVAMYTHQQAHALKQFSRAILLFIITTMLFIGI